MKQTPSNKQYAGEGSTGNDSHLACIDSGAIAPFQCDSVQHISAIDYIRLHRAPPKYFHTISKTLETLIF